MSDTRASTINRCCKKDHDHDEDPSGMLKFSGLAASDVEVGSPVTSHLADPGLGVAADPNNTGYPFAVKRKVRNLAVNIPNYTVLAGGSITIQLRRNGVVVPDFTIVYGSGQTGIKVTHAKKKFHIGDVLDLQVTTQGTTDTSGVNVAATVGLEG